MHDESTSGALRAYVERAAGRFGHDIRVSLDGGVVALDGRVSSPTHARAIVDLVGAQDGVSGVVDRLTVTSGAHSSRSTA